MTLSGDDDAARAGAHLRHAAQQAQPVQLGQHQLREQHIRPQLRDQGERLLTVARGAGKLHALVLLYVRCQ